MLCLQKWRNHFCIINMPYTIRKIKGKDLYSVKSNNRVHSKATTLLNAKRQVRLLYSLERKTSKTRRK